MEKVKKCLKNNEGCRKDFEANLKALPDTQIWDDFCIKMSNDNGGLKPVE